MVVGKAPFSPITTSKSAPNLRNKKKHHQNITPTSLTKTHHPNKKHPRQFQGAMNSTSTVLANVARIHRGFPLWTPRNALPERRLQGSSWRLPKKIEALRKNDGTPYLGDLAITRWAPTSYKWSYNLYKWPYTWATRVITLLMGVITPIYITDRGPPCS